MSCTFTLCRQLTTLATLSGEDMDAYNQRRKILAHMQLDGWTREQAVERYDDMMEALRIMAEEGDNDPALGPLRDTFEDYQRIKRLI